MKRLSLIAMLATPVAAQGTPDPALVTRLLADASVEGRLAGAILACSEIAHTPGIGEGLFNDGGWNPADAAADGTTEYWTEGANVMFRRDPGFCMIETDAMGTDAAFSVLISATEGWPGRNMATSYFGCTTMFLGQGTDIKLTGEGNDPACASETGAALRFTIADQ